MELDEVLNQARILADAYNGIQKSREETSNRIRMMERDHQISEDSARSLHVQTDEKLKEIEKDIFSEMKKLVAKVPVYKQWLQYVVGIGPTYTTKLLAWIGDIARFPKISMIWKYCGLAPVCICANCNKRYFSNFTEAQLWVDKNYIKIENIINTKGKGNKSEKQKRAEDYKNKLKNSICTCNNPQPQMVADKRRKGIATIEYNPQLKSLMWNIGESFVRQGDYYRRLYDDVKAEETAKHPELTPGHIHNRAKRKVVKIFLSHLWVVWRKSEGLSVTEPYSSAVLGHDILPVPMPEDDRI